MSWPSTLGNRHHGSRYAIAVHSGTTKEIDHEATDTREDKVWRDEEEDVDMGDSLGSKINEPHRFIRTQAMETFEDRLSTTNAELTNTICMISDHELIRDGSDPRVRCVVQNDDWEVEWRKRSGILFVRFEGSMEKVFHRTEDTIHKSSNTNLPV